MRTDCHRPSEIIPQDYAYRMSYAGGGSDAPPILVDLALKMTRENPTDFNPNGGGLFTCTVCGAHFRYGDIWEHIPSRRLIVIGHQCAEKYELLADRAEFYQTQRELKIKRAREVAAQELADRKAEFLTQNPGLEQWLAHNHAITNDIRERFERTAFLSEKQIALVKKLATKTEKRCKAPNGRVVISGTVISLKKHDTMYGTTWRITIKVKTDNGVWLAWGTAPRALLDIGALIDRSVEFTANVSRSDRDESFGIFKRPTKAKILTPSSPSA